MAAIPDDLTIELSRRYGLSGRAAGIAPGLSAAKMWRLESTPPVLVRVAEQWPPLDQVQRSCAVATGFARVLRPVPAPLVALDGTTTFLWHDHPVVIWPFLDGSPLDRNDPAQRRLAAGLLADLHRAALEFDGPGAENSFDTYATRPPGPNPSGVPADPGLDDWLARWHHDLPAEEPRGWMHGDFFHGNILCDRTNNITGIVDWDDVQHGPLITELASATWEFASAPGRDMLVVDRVQDFLTAYSEAGGPVQLSADIVPLIRVRLRGSVAFFRMLQSHGHKLDLDNERATIAAFTSLRHFTLDLDDNRDDTR